MAEEKSVLDRLREASEKAKAASDGANEAPKDAKQSAEEAKQRGYDAAMGNGFARNVKDTFDFMGKTARTIRAGFNMASSGWNTVKPYLGPIPRWGKKFWDRAAYAKQPDGSRVFSEKRAAIASAAIAAGLYFGAVPAVKTAFGVVTGTVEGVADAVVYGLTYQEEKGRFQTPILIDPDTRTYRVSVCDLGQSCDANNVTTYLIRDSYFFDFREWTKLKTSYYPDYVQGAVSSPGLECTFTSWGMENWRFMRRYIAEAKIYEIQCNQGAQTPKMN